MTEQLPLRLDGVSYAYGSRRGVDRIGLVVEAGEVCALIGHNGAGKSTAIGLACGRLRPQAGSVRVRGRDPARERAARAVVGFAPQEVALYPKLTVRENLVAFSAFGAGDARPGSAGVDDALRRADAEAIAGRRVESLSGGEKRRANVAAALLGRPALLILDEPSAGVDAESRAVIHGAVRSARADGAAVLVSTHDMDEAEALADRVALMSEGRILRMGRPRDLLAQAFGADAIEVTAFVAERTPDAPRLALRTAGLRAQEDARRWSAITQGRDDAMRLEEQLSRIEGVVELRMRRAGLAALLAVAARDAGASVP